MKQGLFIKQVSHHAMQRYRLSTSLKSLDSFYGEEHVKLGDSLKKLIEKEINPFVDQWEKDRVFPAHTVFKKLGTAGYLGVSKPTEYGGLGLDFTYSIAVAEALGCVNCGGVPMAIGVQTEMATPALAMFGGDELRKQFLMPSIAGDVVACLGVSEPQAGSDVAGIKTVAESVGDDLVINGSKTWITNGCQADWMCLLAITRKTDEPYRNKSLICLPMKTPGVHVSKKIEKIGNYSSDTAQIFFEDVRIPKSFIIGDEGMGFMYQMLQFQLERLFGAALSLTPLEKLVQLTIEYTAQRNVFNKPVLDNQVVHFKLAELQAEIEALRSLVYRATAMYVGGNDVTKFASMAKLKAGRLARTVTDSCLQFWGAMGYTEESLAGRLFRDMRLISIGGGADEVMLSIICKYMGILPKGRKTNRKVQLVQVSF